MPSAWPELVEQVQRVGLDVGVVEEALEARCSRGCRRSDWCRPARRSPTCRRRLVAVRGSCRASGRAPGPAGRPRPAARAGRSGRRRPPRRRCSGRRCSRGTWRPGPRRGRPWCSPGRARRSRPLQLASANLPTCAAPPSEVERCSVAVVERRQVLRQLVQARGGRVEVGRAAGSAASASLPSWNIVGFSSNRKSSSRSKFCARSSRRSAEIAAVSAGVVDEVDDVLAPVGELREDRVRVRVELGDRRVLAAEDVQDLLELLERRGAGADRGVQVLGVAVERGAELVDQQLEAVLERLAQGVLDEVVLDRGLVAGRRDRAARGAGRALPGWQSRKYSAISDCGSEEQLASALNSGKLESDLERDERRLLRGDVEVGDGPGLDAGDPQLRALDEAEGVEELDLVGACRPRPRPSTTSRRRPRRAEPSMSAIRLMARSGSRSGRSRAVPSCGELVARSRPRSLAPGQRCEVLDAERAR